MAINCNDPTPHYPSGCALLKHFDRDGDGVISEHEWWAAEELMMHGDITEEECNFVVAAHNAGSIDALCAGCYSPPAVIAKGEVQNLDYPANAHHGETVTIKASVANVGGTRGEFDLRIIGAEALLLVTRYVGWVAPYSCSVLESLSVTMPSSGLSANLGIQCIRRT